MTDLIFRAEKPFQALAVVDFLGFVEGFPERYGTAMLGNLLKPSSSAVGQHEISLRDPQLFLSLSSFHQ